MVGGKRVLVVVPARGGSKGVPLKNIYPLAGIPLIGHTARLIEDLPFVDRAVLSTDDPEIARIAGEFGLDAPFMRPAELAADWVGDHPVLLNALRETESSDGVEFGVVVMLQPTSPLRRPGHVSSVVEKLVSGRWDAVWTVSPTDLKYHPLKQLVIEEDGSMGYFDPRGAKVVARQQLSPIYHRNGAAYAISRECLVEQGVILGNRSAAVVVEERMISIDTIEDFAEVEAVLGTPP